MLNQTGLSVPLDNVVTRSSSSRTARAGEVNPLPDPIPEPGPGPDEARPVDDSPGLGDPPGMTPGPQPGSWGADGLDYQALVDGLAASGALGSNEDDQDAEFAEWLAAESEGRLEPADPARIAAVAVEHMPPGAAQAGWLEVAAGALGRLDENELIGVTVAAGQQQARAAAAQLTAVAQLCARTAVADAKIGLKADGRPACVSRDALGQIELALKLTHHSTQALADLAVTLTWRLPATLAALRAGQIDRYRAQLIAETTAVLSEELARQVEGQILPDAGQRTSAQLRQRLSYAVIAADPEGAEKRRRDAERSAEMRLYADDDQTATLILARLPQIEAAASFARVTALARARMTAGIPGTLNFHRAQVALGLLNGTLPPIPPAEGAPPDQPPPDPGEDDPGDPGEDDPGDPGSDPGPGCPGSGPAADRDPGDNAGPADGNPNGPDPGDGEPADAGPWDDLPAPCDGDAPPDDGLDGLTGDPDEGWDPAEDDDDLFGIGPTPAWPALGAIPPGPALGAIPPGPTRRDPAQPADGRPVPGLLDVLLPWTTLAGLSERPGVLGRIGPVTAAQARQLAQAAEGDPAAQWRVIVTNAAGQAITVARIRRPRRQANRDPARHSDRPSRARDRPSAGAGLVGRITVTITDDALTAWRQAPGRGSLRGIAAAVLTTGARALAKALAQAEADAAVGGCAHRAQSPGYRPPPRLREHVIARDLTCRNPVCGQPAWRSDLDHTKPWAPGGTGGRTCSCNLGGGCRRDHQLKQHPRWHLEQIQPGWFRWTTPAGRTYTTGPDTHPV
jgi:hypothetical protein